MRAWVIMWWLLDPNGAVIAGGIEEGPRRGWTQEQCGAALAEWRAMLPDQSLMDADCRPAFQGYHKIPK